MSFNIVFFFFSSRRRHTRWNCDWSSDVCSSDLTLIRGAVHRRIARAARTQARVIERANMHLGCPPLRGRCARDHGAILNRSWRPGDIRSHIHRAKRAVLRRLDPDRVGHLCASQKSCCDVRSSAVDGLAIHEGIAIRHSHSIQVTRMDVIEVANVGVENIRVADERVVHVDDRNEIPAATEPREERFTEAQREPADSETKPAAEETDKSGTIDGIAAVRTRAPAPPAAKIIPTAVMVRRETPGRIVNPGPAPRADPVPIAVAVGSPVRRNFARIPNMAILGLIAPVTVIIQIAVAGRIARNVLSGNGVVFFQVALSGPTIEAVRTGSPVNVVLDVVRAVEFSALPRMNFIGLAAGGYFTF